MFQKIQRKTFNGHIINIIEISDLIFGFTEQKFPLPYLSEFFRKAPVLQLKQIHSDKILFSDQPETDNTGDGIILNTRFHLAVIKTADCVPLTFWEESSQIAGIIHVGWRGLLKGIETKLLNILSNIQLDKKKLGFFIGPSIEQKCYPVGREIYNLFAGHTYRDQVFQMGNHPRSNLDLKKAITLSLTNSGIPPQRIVNSKICNFCELQRFPSFRRGSGSDNRIYNFIMRK